jgi:hypothetical protein
VSRERGYGRFIIGEESYLGRLTDSSEEGMTPLKNGVFSVESGITSYRLITVATTSVDRVVVDEGLTRVALVKIAVEGGELNVLYGMSETLRRHKPMFLIEFHSSELEERGISFLKEQGYQCELLDRARPPAKHCHHLCRPL